MIRKLSAAILIALCFSISSIADAPKSILKPTNKPESWIFEQHETAKGTCIAEGDAIVFNVTESDGTDWHVQAEQIDLDLKDGKEYVVTFKAKASADRTVTLSAAIHQEDWHNIGLSEGVEMTKDWKDFKYEFKADQTVAGKNRIGFVLGNDKGKVWVKEMTLTAK
jgi:hypothetical protein